MRIWFIYIVSVSLFAGCKQHTASSVNENEPLYSQPLSFPLDLSSGYIINPFTGDSINPMINSNGDSIRTGVPFMLKGTTYNFSKYYKPKTFNATPLSKLVLKTNEYLVKGQPDIIPANGTGDTRKDLTSNRIGVNRDYTYGNLVTGKLIPAVGTVVPLYEPKPVRILPMRFKDNATHDIQYLDVAQGLAYSYVLDIMQDKNGCIWLGTDGYGLCKYDGVYMSTYKVENGLAGNQVNSIKQDEKGNILIGTNKGLSIFDGKKFIQYTAREGLPHDQIDKIIKDNDGNFWINTGGIGVTFFDGKNFETYSEKEGLPDDSGHSLLKDSKGNIWWCTISGVSIFDGKHFKSFNKQLKILNGIYSIVEDSKGNLWFASAFYGLIKYDGKNFTHFTEENGLPDNSIMSMRIDGKDNLWIATRYNGLCKFDGLRFTIFSSEQGLSDNKLINTIEDSQGNIWISTSGGGICKLNENGFSEKIKLDYLGSSRVRPVLEDPNGDLWLGTEGAGLYRYNGTNIEKLINPDLALVAGLRSALLDKKGNLWFGESDGSSLYKYDHGRFLYYNPLRKISSILSLYEDKANTIWIGTTDEGVAAYNGTEISYYSEKEGFPSLRVFVTMQDKNGNIWFGTGGGGLVKYDGRNFIVYSERQGLFAKSITSIKEDGHGNLWFGTLQAGLCKFDGTQFTYYTEQQGMSFNDIWSVQEDKNGYIWAGTDKGLSVLIPKKDSLKNDSSNYFIYNFGQQDGLKSTDFNLKSVCIDKNNRIWWGTGKALVTRNLNEPFKPSSLQSLSISHIEINERFYDFRNLQDSNNSKINFSSIAPFHNYPNDLTLTYDQNHVIFHFAAIDWTAPHKIKYSYRLLGSDREWSTPSSETSADYRNLAYGKYQFQVKAIGQSQEWTKVLSYSFIIHPAWWQTWWFKTIVIIFSILALVYTVWLIYLYRLRKQRGLMEKQLAVQYERQRISSEMHDDIGAGLSGVRLLTEMTKNKLKDKESAEDIAKIYESVGDISAKMKEVIWSLNAENDHLNNLVYYLQKQVKAQLENYAGELTFDIPETIPDVTITGDIRRNIYLLVKEAVHNIIKHSGANKIKIDIQFNGEMTMTISDNGQGIDLTQSYYAGNGMKNMRKRIQQLNGLFQIKNINGVTLIFTIPLKPAL